MKGFVYSLKCPVNGTPVYVGSTLRSLKQRKAEHSLNVRNSLLPVYEYFRKIDVDPEITLIAEVEVESRRELIGIEKSWIAKYKEDGVSLFNKSMTGYSVNYESVKVKISPEIWKTVKVYCKKNRIGLVDFIGQAIVEKLEKEKK